MALADSSVDFQAFLAWSGRDLSQQTIEAFSCRECNHTVIGAPDEHTIYFNPNNAQDTSFYNGAKTIQCPICSATWYASGFTEYRVNPFNAEELSKTAWAWLVKKE